MADLANIAAQWAALPPSGPVHFGAKGALRGSFQSLPHTRTSTVHHAPGGCIATDVLNWDRLHNDPQIGPHIRNYAPYLALEHALRNPAAGAAWSAGSVQVGFNRQRWAGDRTSFAIALCIALFSHALDIHEWLIRIELHTPEQRPFGVTYHELTVTRQYTRDDVLANNGAPLQH